MACYYYILTSIVIEYMSKDNRYCTITTDSKRERRYLLIPPDYCLQPLNKQTRINEYLIDVLLQNSYKEVLFENSTWSNEEYRLQYSTKYLQFFPHIERIVKISKNVQSSKYI